MSLPLVTGHVSLAASRLRLPGGATQLSGVATVGCTPLPGRAEEVGPLGVWDRSQGCVSVESTGVGVAASTCPAQQSSPV